MNGGRTAEQKMLQGEMGNRETSCSSIPPRLSPCVSGASWGRREPARWWRQGRERESTWQGQHKDRLQAYCALFLCWLGGERQNYAVLWLQSSTSAHCCHYQWPVKEKRWTICLIHRMFKTIIAIPLHLSCRHTCVHTGWHDPKERQSH